ncbi:MAG: hypothetical protein WC824_02400 [Bacteroidota bacterium]|jgi:hypothetical protein
MSTRFAFPFMFIFTMLLSGILDCGAQQLSQTSPALQLCTRPFWSSSPLTLAVNEMGEALVVWGDSAAWADMSPALLDRELLPGNVVAVYGLEGENWTGVYTIGERLTGGSQGWTSDYRFGRGHGGTLLHSSEVFQTDARVMSMQEPGSAYGATTVSISGWKYGDGVILERNQDQYSTWAGANSDEIECEILRWAPGELYASLYKTENGGGWHDWADSSRGMLRVSAPVDDECVVYQRADLPNDKPFSGNSQHFIRGISLLHPGTGALQPFITLDTLHNSELDLSDVVLPRSGGMIDVLRRDMRNDNLFVERFDFRGNKRDNLPLVDLVHVYHVHNDTLTREKAMEDAGMTRADYAALPIDSGRTLLAWSAPAGDDRTELRMALFDTDWRRIGPEHIVSSGEGWRVHPALAARDQRVYVVWQHRLSQGSTPWLRVYALDQLLSTATTPMETELEIDAPWPQPATSRVHVSVRGVRPDEELHFTVFDALGRVVMKHAYTSPAPLQLSVDVSKLGDGWYTMLLTTAKQAKATRFSVIRGGKR